MSGVDDALRILNAPPPRVSTGLASFLSPHSVNYSDEEEEIKSRDKLKNPLQGLVASILDCTNCHHRSPTRNVVFHDIAVSLTQHQDEALTVHRCLLSYFMRETIDDVECTG